MAVSRQHSCERFAEIILARLLPTAHTLKLNNTMKLLKGVARQARCMRGIVFPNDVQCPSNPTWAC